MNSFNKHYINSLFSINPPMHSLTKIKLLVGRNICKTLPLRTIKRYYARFELSKQ